MNRTPLTRRQTIAALAALALTPWPALGQSVPKVVRLIVPYSPGGGTDILTRNLAESLATELGTTVIVENKPGGGTIIGTQEVIRSAADGSTLLMGDLALAVNPSLIKNLPFDPIKDLSPIALVATAPLVLVVRASTGIKTVADLVAQAKANPGQLSFASAGNGNPPHLAGELFRHTTNSNILHVPYKGVGPALTDLLGGHVTMMFTGISSTKQHIDSGVLNALAVTGAQRAPTLPNVPTMAQAGFESADVSSWWALFAPVGLPPALAARYASAVERALSGASLRDKFEARNIVASYAGPDVLRKRLQSETKTWADVVKAANLKAD